MMSVLLGQTIDPSGLAGSGWANATIGGVAVALLVVLAYMLRLWTDERKNYNEQTKSTTEQLVSVIQASNEVTSNNTQAITSMSKQNEMVIDKVDDLRSRLMSRPCLLKPDVSYRDTV